MTSLPDMRQFQSTERVSVAVPDLLSIVAVRYERCHPQDSFADLRNRARFSKEDRRLLEDWLAAIGAEIGYRAGPREGRR